MTVLRLKIFSLFSKQNVYRAKPAALAEGKALIDDCIYFYNHQRIRA